MNCFTHPDAESTGNCLSCSRRICPDCSNDFGGTILCLTCAHVKGENKKAPRRAPRVNVPQVDRGSTSYSCSHCGSTSYPSTTTRINTAGWVIFAVLLIACWVICWIPFVLDSCKDTIQRCHRCGFETTFN